MLRPTRRLSSSPVLCASKSADISTPLARLHRYSIRITFIRKVRFLKTVSTTKEHFNESENLEPRGALRSYSHTVSTAANTKLQITSSISPRCCCSALYSPEWFREYPRLTSPETAKNSTATPQIHKQSPRSSSQHQQSAGSSLASSASSSSTATAEREDGCPSGTSTRGAG